MFKTRSGLWFRDQQFRLGNLYLTNRNEVVKFIQVTRKGFNLLNVHTHRCILRHHLYARKWSNKEIPTDIKKFTVAMPDYILVTEIPVKMNTP